MPDLPPNARKKASTSFLARDDAPVGEKRKDKKYPYPPVRLHLRFIHGAP